MTKMLLGGDGRFQVFVEEVAGFLLEVGPVDDVLLAGYRRISRFDPGGLKGGIQFLRVLDRNEGIIDPVPRSGKWRPGGARKSAGWMR